jgi:mono/diheme cytochrome c family protein
MTTDDVAKWCLSVFPDGRGLPEGRGTAIEGRRLFDAHCARCHGEEGRGATAEELVAPLDPPPPAGGSKAIGPYWPYATTIFDFVRRSMPADAPGSLSVDQVYAITAYLLAANKIIADTDVLDARSLPAVKMPNRDKFDWIDAPK